MLITDTRVRELLNFGVEGREGNQRDCGLEAKIGKRVSTTRQTEIVSDIDLSRKLFVPVELTDRILVTDQGPARSVLRNNLLAPPDSGATFLSRRTTVFLYSLGYIGR